MSEDFPWVEISVRVYPATPEEEKQLREAIERWRKRREADLSTPLWPLPLQE